MGAYWLATPFFTAFPASYTAKQWNTFGYTSFYFLPLKNNSITTQLNHKKEKRTSRASFKDGSGQKGVAQGPVLDCVQYQKCKLVLTCTRAATAFRTAGAANIAAAGVRTALAPAYPNQE